MLTWLRQLRRARTKRRQALLQRAPGAAALEPRAGEQRLLLLGQGCNAGLRILSLPLRVDQTSCRYLRFGDRSKGFLFGCNASAFLRFDSRLQGLLNAFRQEPKRRDLRLQPLELELQLADARSWN